MQGILSGLSLTHRLAASKQATGQPWCSALVLSPAAYNDKVSLAVCCPLSTKVKGYPFEVEVASGKTTSVVLSDQVKSLDWRERNAKFKSKISPAQLKQVRDNIKALLCIT
jgi:mRNA interferase MazF